VNVILPYQSPIDVNALLGFLAARATPGVEHVDTTGYWRTLSLDGHAGVVHIGAELPLLRLEVSASLEPVLEQIRLRARHLFDLDASPATIDAHLEKGFGAMLSVRPGLRVPGAFDGFELAIRAILGQQVSVKGASTLMARFAAAFGVALETDHVALVRLAVTAERVADASLSTIRAIGLPNARAATIHTLARAVASGSLRIEPDADVAATMGQLRELPGIGPWTAEYIAMRAMHWSDAFPASDLVLRRNAGNPTAAQMVRMAEEWRPYRAYAAMQLWMKTHHVRGLND
jgi:AraC family transcriptional regulator of adaptative response / DNA-3-methyladenine glycosylase II